MANLSLVDTDLTTAILSKQFGVIPGGQEKSYRLGYKNNNAGTLANIQAACWPDIVGGQPQGKIKSAIVICMNGAQEKQATAVTRESSDAIATPLKLMGKVFTYDGSNYTPIADGDPIPFPTSSNKKVYILLDYIVLNYYFGFSDFGSYSGFAIKCYNGSAYAVPTGLTDGTNGAAQDGNVNFGTVDQVIWQKDTIQGFSGYGIEISCTGVTTPAVADEAYTNLVYQLPHSCILGVPSAYWDKTAGGSYSAVGTPELEYCNKGVFAYNTNPLAEGSSLAIAHSYKNPQPDTYVITFHYVNSAIWSAGTAFALNSFVEPTVLNGYYYEATTATGNSSGIEPTWPTTPGSTVVDGSITWTCRQGTGTIPFCKVNRGTAIAVTLDGTRYHYGVIPGVQIVFQSNILITDSCSIKISEALENLWYAKDGDTNFVNRDYIVTVSLASGAVVPITFKDNPPIGVTSTDNNRRFQFYGYGDMQ